MNSQYKKNLETLIKDQKLSEAQEYLQSIKEQISESTYFYNLGVLYNKMGKHPYSRWAFEKSFYAGAGSLKSWHNWNFLSEQKGFDQVESRVHHPFFYNQYIYGLFFCFVAASVFVFIKKLKLKQIIVTCTAFAFIVTGYLYLFSGSPAILVEKAQVKEGPSSLLDTTGEIEEGIRIVVTEESEGWAFVQYPLSLSGWINKRSILKVK